MCTCECVCVPELLCVVLLYFQPLLDKLCVALEEVDPPLSVFVQTVKLVLQMKKEGWGGGIESHIKSSQFNYEEVHKRSNAAGKIGVLHRFESADAEMSLPSLDWTGRCFPARPQP